MSVSSQDNIESNNVEREERYTVALAELDARNPRFTLDQQAETEFVSRNVNNASPLTGWQESSQKIGTRDGQSHRTTAHVAHQPFRLHDPRLPNSNSLEASHRSPPRAIQPDANNQHELHVGQRELRLQSGANSAKLSTVASSWSTYSRETSIKPTSPAGPTELYETSPQRLTDRVGEQWPDFTFAEGPNHSKKGFNFAHSPVRSKPELVKTDLTTQSSSEDYGDLYAAAHLRNSSPRTAGISPSKTFRTSANTTLFRPASDEELYSSYNVEPSETDFLTYLSPMEGYIDESFERLSVHNNPARTQRSYLPVLSTTNETERTSAPLDLVSRSAREGLPSHTTKSKRYGAESTKVPLFTTPQRFNMSRPQVSGHPDQSNRLASVAPSSDVAYRDFAYEIDADSRPNQDARFQSPAAREQQHDYGSRRRAPATRGPLEPLSLAMNTPRARRQHQNGGLVSITGSAASVRRQPEVSSSYFATSSDELYQHSPASAKLHRARPPPSVTRSQHFSISSSSSTSQATPATLKRQHQHLHVADSTGAKRARLFQEQPVHRDTHMNTTYHSPVTNAHHHRQTLDDFRPFIGEYLRSKGF